MFFSIVLILDGRLLGALRVLYLERCNFAKKWRAFHRESGIQ